MLACELNEDIDTIITVWPEQKFTAVYGAFCMAKVEEEIRHRKDAMIAALHANSAFMESKEGQDLLKNRIEEIEANAAAAIDHLWGGDTSDEESEFVDDDPYGFFAAGQRALEQDLL